MYGVWSIGIGIGILGRGGRGVRGPQVPHRVLLQIIRVFKGGGGWGRGGIIDSFPGGGGGGNGVIYL